MRIRVEFTAPRGRSRRRLSGVPRKSGVTWCGGRRRSVRLFRVLGLPVRCRPGTFFRWRLVAGRALCGRRGLRMSVRVVLEQVAVVNARTGRMFSGRRCRVRRLLFASAEELHPGRPPRRTGLVWSGTAKLDGAGLSRNKVMPDTELRMGVATL